MKIILMVTQRTVKSISLDSNLEMANGQNIKWTKNGKIRIEAKSFDKYLWELSASKITTEPTFVINICEL